MHLTPRGLAGFSILGNRCASEFEVVRHPICLGATTCCHANYSLSSRHFLLPTCSFAASLWNLGLSAHMAAVRQTKEPTYKAVDRSTVWIAPGSVPELGLVALLSFPFRVYALECQAPHGQLGPYIYVGIAHASKIGDRLKGHWKGGATHFTDEHRPKKVLLIYPAANRAVESYVFHAYLSLQCSGRVHTLGGWTQTSSDPSRLARQQFEQERRNLLSRCFNCGAGNHLAKDCKKPLEGITYPCPKCGTEIVVSSRGQTRPGTKANAKSSGGHPVAPPPLAPDSSGSKRKAQPASTAPAAKVAKAGATSSNHGKVVSVCGKQYCGLCWFLGQANPAPKVCARVRQECVAGALEMQGGTYVRWWATASQVDLLRSCAL